MKQKTLIALRLVGASIKESWKLNEKKAHWQESERAKGQSFMSNYYSTDLATYTKRWVDSPDPLFDIAARIIVYEEEGNDSK